MKVKPMGGLLSSKSGSQMPLVISAPEPSSFVHVAHVGLNVKGDVETSSGVDPVWVNMMKDLRKHNLSPIRVEDKVKNADGLLPKAQSANSKVDSVTHVGGAGATFVDKETSS